MRRFSTFAIASTFTLVPLTGCQNEDTGQVHSRQQHQHVSDDGRTATQTQTQIRETPSGTTVKETATRQREVVNPPPGTQPVDPTKRDPGSPGSK